MIEPDIAEIREVLKNRMDAASRRARITPTVDGARRAEIETVVIGDILRMLALRDECRPGDIVVDVSNSLEVRIVLALGAEAGRAVYWCASIPPVHVVLFGNGFPKVYGVPRSHVRLATAQEAANAGARITFAEANTCP